MEEINAKCISNTNNISDKNTNNILDKNADGIYKHIDIVGVRKLLINNPTLCALFELICIHINSIITK